MRILSLDSGGKKHNGPDFPWFFVIPTDRLIELAKWLPSFLRSVCSSVRSVRSPRKTPRHFFALYPSAAVAGGREEGVATDAFCSLAHSCVPPFALHLFAKLFSAPRGEFTVPAREFTQPSAQFGGGDGSHGT